MPTKSNAASSDDLNMGRILTTLATVAVRPKQCTQGLVASSALCPCSANLLTARFIARRVGRILTPRDHDDRRQPSSLEFFCEMRSGGS